jgi:hypothetical protein
VVDDLKPVLGAYGDVDAFTPNLDLLAAKELDTGRAATFCWSRSLIYWPGSGFCSGYVISWKMIQNFRYTKFVILKLENKLKIKISQLFTEKIVYAF